MIENLQQFLEDIVENLLKFAHQMEVIVGRFFHGLLLFLEETYRWMVSTTKRYLTT